MPEDTLEQISAKRTSFERLHSGHNWLNLKIASDCFITAMFSKKTGGIPSATDLARPKIPMTDHVWAAIRGQTIYGPLVGIADRIANEVSAFHWPIEFPDIFSGGGFDAVIGNPPWERIKLQEQEFFAARSPSIAMAPTKSDRERLIKDLEKADPNTHDGLLWTEFQFAKRTAEATSEFARGSGRYPLTGRGDVNTYALFAEHFVRLARAEGRAGIIVPTGIATDNATSEFFGHLIDHKLLRALFGFYEIRGWFKETDDRKSFCILCVGGTPGEAAFCFDIKSINDLIMRSGALL